MEARFPNLLIIGAMKSGTSSLHEYLNLHPDIFMSEPKEIHYYADINYNEEFLQKYKEHFISDKKILGTSPQSYTKCHNKFYKNIPERIYQDTPYVKMIYIVRNPIKRYASHVLESYHCDPIEDIEYSKKTGNYVKTGMYGMQLQEYLKFFKREQIHILTTEDLNENRLVELNKIFNFLGVKEFKDGARFDFVSNAAESKFIPRFIRSNKLYTTVRKVAPAFIDKIVKKCCEVFLRDQMNKPVLTNEEELELRRVYSEDLVLFKELSGINYDNWNL